MYCGRGVSAAAARRFAFLLKRNINYYQKGSLFMYQALYRKWRPKTFDDVVGQEHISEILKRQIISGRLSHAYLFVGTRGTGKTTCAKILSRAINCTNPQNGNPCNNCASCTGIEQGSILDVVELDAASNNGVDNVRALREEAVFTPVDVKKRVYIIDEVHMLSNAAFNALLKILEEPPEHLVFILATTEIHKVPATVLSRCQRYTFKRILPEEISKRLRHVADQEGFVLTTDASGLLARLADGSLRDALSLLDQCASEDTVDRDRVLSAIGLAGSNETANLLSAIADRNIIAALEQLDRLYAGGKFIASVIDELAALVRDVLVTALMPNGATALLSGNFDQTTLDGFAGRFTVEELLSAADLLRETILDLPKCTGGKLSAELCLMRLCDRRLSSRPDAMLSRISRLEEIFDQVDNSPSPVKIRRTGPDAAPLAPEQSKDAYSQSEPPLPKQVPESAQSPALQPKDMTGEAPSDKQSALPSELWNEILKRVKTRIDIPPYTFLSDPAHTTAEIQEGVLTIKAKNAFTAQIINVQPVMAELKEAATGVLKRPVTVRVIQDGGGVTVTNEKLNALKRYPNVIFE